jgi:hypothetical protein
MAVGQCEFKSIDLKAKGQEMRVFVKGKCECVFTRARRCFAQGKYNIFCIYETHVTTLSLTGLVMLSSLS